MPLWPQEIDLALPPNYQEADITDYLQKEYPGETLKFTVVRKSLDARRKGQILWRLQLLVGPVLPEVELLDFTAKKSVSTPARVLIVGSGPAGFFAGLALVQAGYKVTILEQGPSVEERQGDIALLEKTGELQEFSNYAFGEGGAGTFSDGKLTARGKNMDREKEFIFQTFIQAGAPAEIRYLQHPHLGSDNLFVMVQRLRKIYQDLGGEIIFRQSVIDLVAQQDKVSSLRTLTQEYVADYYIFAPGNAALATLRLLMAKGAVFQPKPFAIGVRVEHPQTLINQAQWGVPELPGMKAAEYHLTHTASNRLPVYSFCMCPGGQVIPAAARAGVNVVNGVSNYQRASAFANAALVVGVDLTQLIKSAITAEESLAWVESLEEKAFAVAGNLTAPCNTIGAFLFDKITTYIPPTSYPLGLKPYAFSELLPAPIIKALQEGLRVFKNKIRGFETGLLLGVETKTSSPLRVVRAADRSTEGLSNLYVCGEGSGLAGGIISSAVDGLKTAQAIINQ